MVSSNAMALTTRATRPTTPSRLARLENWVMAPSTGRAIVSGTRVETKYCCSVFCRVENIGKAENSASITVASGTSEMTEVKVRLLAVSARRSSRKRRISVSSVPSHGHACSRLKTGPMGTVGGFKARSGKSLLAS